MPRPWRTVYRSPSKHVMVRSDAKPHTPLNDPADVGSSSWIETGLFVVSGYIAYEILCAFWPWFVLAGLIWLAYYLFFSE